jgi:hypothetical protein
MDSGYVNQFVQKVYTLLTGVLQATNQLLLALDRIRDLPNVIVLCTSNLIEAIVSV